MGSVHPSRAAMTIVYTSWLLTNASMTNLWTSGCSGARRCSSGISGKNEQCNETRKTRSTKRSSQTGGLSRIMGGAASRGAPLPNHRASRWAPISKDGRRTGLKKKRTGRFAFLHRCPFGCMHSACMTCKHLFFSVLISMQS